MKFKRLNAQRITTVREQMMYDTLNRFLDDIERLPKEDHRNFVDAVELYFKNLK